MSFDWIKNIFFRQQQTPLKEAIHTERLILLPLTRKQLGLYLRDRPALEEELVIPLSEQILTDTVRRAIRSKIKKMRMHAPEDHLWLTYWLVVIKANSFGAGLVGFKKLPDSEGSVEIGYGIDEGCQGQGYMTEAVRALINWAFQYPLCKKVTATTVVNPASNRLLEKLGGRITEQSKNETSWVIDRPEVLI